MAQLNLYNIHGKSRPASQPAAEGKAQQNKLFSDYIARPSKIYDSISWVFPLLLFLETDQNHLCSIHPWIVPHITQPLNNTRVPACLPLVCLLALESRNEGGRPLLFRSARFLGRCINIVGMLNLFRSVPYRNRKSFDRASGLWLWTQMSTHTQRRRRRRRRRSSQYNIKIPISKASAQRKGRIISTSPSPGQLGIMRVCPLYTASSSLLETGTWGRMSEGLCYLVAGCWGKRDKTCVWL